MRPEAVAPERAPGERAVTGFDRFRQVDALDGLRGMAILLVVLSHLDELAVDGVRDLRGHDLTPVGPLNDLLDGGFLGVDLFFVLSGFLITTLLAQERRASGAVRFGRFYARRALRLLPALYVFLAAHVAYAVAADLHGTNEAWSIGGALLYVSNWVTADNLFRATEGTGHLWSLAVEEQFYLMWPAVLLLLARADRSTRLLRAVLVAAIVGVALHRADLWSDGVHWLQVFVRTDTRIDALLIGALAAVVWGGRSRPLPPGFTAAAWVAAVVLVGILPVADYEAGFVYLGGFSLFAVAAAVVVVAAVDTEWGGNHVLRLPALQLLGRVSYGLYLWHLLVFYAVRRWADDVPIVPRIALALAVSLAVTTLSHWVVERPALRLKRRFAAPRPTPVGTAPGPRPD
jgi:peptidoglycan/LPS O-acetylase OafA/YrhL